MHDCGSCEEKRCLQPLYGTWVRLPVRHGLCKWMVVSVTFFLLEYFLPAQIS